LRVKVATEKQNYLANKLYRKFLTKIFHKHFTYDFSTDFFSAIGTFTDVTFWVLACELQSIGHRNSCKITHSGADNFGTKTTRHFFFGAADDGLHRF
jgi:hypothetical protein